MNDPDVMGDEDVSLCNNMTEPPLLEDQTSSQHNHALVAVVALSMLYYAQSEHFNIIQKLNTQFAFTNNVPKRFVESFHQMSTLVLYESLRCGLQANAKAVIETILKKTQNHRFFISYENINFYKNIRDQQIFNCSALVNYTAGYIYFMKTLNGINNLDYS